MPLPVLQGPRSVPGAEVARAVTAAAAQVALQLAAETMCPCHQRPRGHLQMPPLPPRAGVSVGYYSGDSSVGEAAAAPDLLVTRVPQAQQHHCDW